MCPILSHQSASTFKHKYPHQTACCRYSNLAKELCLEHCFPIQHQRDVTAQFVMQTFYEWFLNSTIDTIRKNLRTTTGKHKIKIDENIIKHPTISNWEEKTSIKQMREILIFIDCYMMLMQTDSIKLMLKLISLPSSWKSFYHTHLNTVDKCFIKGWARMDVIYFTHMWISTLILCYRQVRSATPLPPTSVLGA